MCIIYETPDGIMGGIGGRWGEGWDDSEGFGVGWDN